MRVAGLVIGCALLGAFVLPGTSAPRPSEGTELLEPGSVYLANFSFDERREACMFLDYVEGTTAFSQCLEGDFPENPWFAS